MDRLSWALLCLYFEVLYVNVAHFESGCIFWPAVFARMCFALAVGQVTLVGVFSLKNAFPQVFAHKKFN